MSKSKYIVGGLAALLVGYAYSKTNEIKNTIKFLQYSVSSVKFRMKGLVPEIIFGIKIYNPNKGAVPVNEFFGTISDRGTLIASFKNSEPVNLNGGEENVITIAARISAIALIAKIASGKLAKTVQVDGVIKTPFFSMPVQKEVSLVTGNVTDTVTGFHQKRLLRQRIMMHRRPAPHTTEFQTTQI
ncbi:MAG: LEA type 2 family protein [Ferruginibacter sp.]|nr:LEA type 2 family protein [Ferruginibacter sp.]